jgi:hypothetical protein
MSNDAQSAEILVLPGVERRDLMVPLPGTKVLEAAIEAGVEEVTIVGRARDGNLYITTSVSDADKAAGMMMRAVNWLTSVDIEADQPNEHGEDDGA